MGCVQAIVLAASHIEQSISGQPIMDEGEVKGGPRCQRCKTSRPPERISPIKDGTQPSRCSLLWRARPGR
eukprot:4154354-Amphidinium_carterae.2